MKPSSSSYAISIRMRYLAKGEILAYRAVTDVVQKYIQIFSRGGDAVGHPYRVVEETGPLKISRAL